jgi:lysophospholipase L1-like esterase
MERFLARLRGGQKVTLVALGDSNTELTWHTRGHLNWVGLLQEALFETYGRNRAFVINAGRCGDTAAACLAERLDDDALRFRPDLVIVGFGANEAAGGHADLPGRLTAYQAALRGITDRCRAAGAEVLLRTPSPFFNQPMRPGLIPGEPPAGEITGYPLAEFAAACVAVGAELGCPVVDHYTRWQALLQRRGTCREEPNLTWLLMSDTVHPGPQGHLAYFKDLAAYFGVPARFAWETHPE